MKKYKLILIIVLLMFSASEARTSSPLLWGGNSTSLLLQDNLNFHNLVSFLTGSDDPTVVAKSAPAGSFYFRTTGLVYIKLDAGLSTNWAFMLDTSSVQFLSNKILVEKITALVDAATITTDAATGNVFTVTLGGNRTLANPTNPTNGQRVTWRVKQDGTGSRTLAFGAAFRFGTDLISATLSTTAGKLDFIGAIYNGNDAKWDVTSFIRGY